MKLAEGPASWTGARLASFTLTTPTARQPVQAGCDYRFTKAAGSVEDAIAAAQQVARAGVEYDGRTFYQAQAVLQASDGTRYLTALVDHAANGTPVTIDRLPERVSVGPIERGRDALLAIVGADTIIRF